jgi:hypothetical protein
LIVLREGNWGAYFGFEGDGLYYIDDVLRNGGGTGLIDAKGKPD